MTNLRFIQIDVLHYRDNSLDKKGDLFTTK
jgi:hypothetical protein